MVLLRRLVHFGEDVPGVRHPSQAGFRKGLCSSAAARRSVDFWRCSYLRAHSAACCSLAAVTDSTPDRPPPSWFCLILDMASLIFVAVASLGTAAMIRRWPAPTLSLRRKVQSSSFTQSSRKHARNTLPAAANERCTRQRTHSVAAGTTSAAAATCVQRELLLLLMLLVGLHHVLVRNQVVLIRLGCSGYSTVNVSLLGHEQLLEKLLQRGRTRHSNLWLQVKMLQYKHTLSLVPRRRTTVLLYGLTSRDFATRPGPSGRLPPLLPQTRWAPVAGPSRPLLCCLPEPQS
jgi:hypothetical protein